MEPLFVEYFFSHSSQTQPDSWDPYFLHLEELEIEGLMLVDLEPYNTVLGLEIPFGMSRFHRQLSVHVVSTKHSVALLTSPVPNETEVLQNLEMVLVLGGVLLFNGSLGILVEVR